MAKKVSDSQVAGIKAHAEAKNKETIDKVNKAIDKLKRKNKPINFETVCKEAGVSRATLYNNAQLKERILREMKLQIFLTILNALLQITKKKYVLYLELTTRNSQFY